MNFKCVVCVLLLAVIANVAYATDMKEEHVETSTVSPLADMAMLGKC